uniref:Uncharacterized protein n=1 Tax=viral metagenome TaxID=1070528 RepID=A0A6H1ZZ97_9ZZZZ
MTTATKQTRLEQLQKACGEVGLWVDTYSPGDGITRYRFFKEAGNSYFGPKNGIYTALGFKEARTFARGAGAII